MGVDGEVARANGRNFANIANDRLKINFFFELGFGGSNDGFDLGSKVGIGSGCRCSCGRRSGGEGKNWSCKNKTKGKNGGDNCKFFHIIQVSLRYE